MKGDAFRAWLTSSFAPNTVSTQFSCAKRVEEAYGDLDLLYDADGLEGLAASLAYSSADGKAGLPNPTRLSVSGNLYTTLASYKSAVRCYARFRDAGEEIASETAIEIAAASIQATKAGKLFELEAHLQKALRAEIGQLEPGLTIVDGGIERVVASGEIDILARDAAGALVAIELKRDLARRDAIGQVLGYMGDLMAEEPGEKVRGMIVAGDFDKSCLGAARAIPSLALLRYRFDFRFEPVGAEPQLLVALPQ